MIVEDHNPPLFDMLVAFVRRAESFMDEAPHNVIAVHCKGGKGRTGTLLLKASGLMHEQFKASWTSSFRPQYTCSLRPHGRLALGLKD